MALTVALIAGFAVFDGALRWLVILAGACVEVGEAAVMIRLSRRRRALTGPEALVGRAGVVTRPCHPEGGVRLDGELWAARCAAGADAGDRVTVVAVDGLTLVVRRDPQA